MSVLRCKKNFILWVIVTLLCLLWGFLLLSDWITTTESAVGLTKVSEEPVDQDDHQQVRNHHRRMTVARYCLNVHTGAAKKMRSTDWNNLDIYKKPRLYYTDNAKFIICETPKCGSTEWRDWMLKIDGYIKDDAPDKVDRFEQSWEKNFMWTRFDPSEHALVVAADKRLKNYYKVMTTREPLQRLVSAYRDKLEADTNPYYEVVSKKIHKEMNPKSTEGLASFEEFVDFILSTANPIDLDPHWRPYSLLCDPCKIHYDYIAKMETIYEDAAAIKKYSGIKRDISLFNGTDIEEFQRSRSNLTNQYFGKLPYNKSLAIFMYFRDQYDMFDYEYPNFIRLTDIPGFSAKNEIQ